jgi:hypothetical protein
LVRRVKVLSRRDGDFFQSMSRGLNRAAGKTVRVCPAGKVDPPGKKVLPGEAGKDLLE